MIVILVLAAIVATAGALLGGLLCLWSRRIWVVVLLLSAMFCGGFVVGIQGAPPVYVPIPVPSKDAAINPRDWAVRP